MSDLTLNYWTRADVALERAIADFVAAGGTGVALLSDPNSYHVCLIDSSGVCCGPDGEVSVENVFEARCFRDDAELRWRRNPEAQDRSGKAAVISEEPLQLDASIWTKAHITASDRLDCTYLLAGDKYGAHDRTGWSMSSSSGVNEIVVPFAVTKPKRLQLVGYEYVAVEPQNGNSYVAGERLMRIQEAKDA